MAALYGIVGLFLWRKNAVLMRCSESHGAAQKHGHNVRLWDFLFYSAFGLVVTSSVKAAGVLAVFTFLIVPSVCAVLLGKKGNAQLIWAWLIGIGGSATAVSLSYARDWPTGASVVCVFGCLVTVVSVFTHARFSKVPGDHLRENEGI
jgi:zinc/manganese transport system permease protein